MLRRAHTTLAFLVRAALAFVASTASAAQAPSAAPDVATAQPAPAVLAGRFLLEGGKPAVGVSIELTGYPLRPKPGVGSEAWRSPLARTADDGRFELAFDAPPSHQFTLNVRVPGHVGASWRWNALRAGERVELGEFVLQRGGAIGGRIVDAEGRPLRESWTVYADRVRATYGTRGEPLRAQAAYDPTEGRFLLEDLPPGPVRVQAYSRMGGWLEGPTLDVTADEIAEADLVYAGPDNTRRIAVQLSTQPFYALANEIEAVFLSAPGVEPRPGRRDSRTPGWIVFDDLEAGPYTIEVRDPRFRTWKRDGVEPGTPLDARLVGAGALVLDVRDATTNEPVRAYGLRTRFEASLLRGNTIDLLPAGSSAPSSGRLGGFVPVAQTLVVTAEGYAPAEVLVDTFDAPATGANEPRTDATPQGELASGSGGSERANESSARAGGTANNGSGATDSSSGASVGANRAQGNTNSANDTADTASSPSTTSSDAPNTPARIVTIALGRGFTIDGRLVESDGTTPVAFVEVHVVSQQDSGGMTWSPWSDAQTRKTTSDARGRFRFDALAAGGYRVRAVRSLLETARADVTLGGPPPPTPDAPGALPTSAPGATPPIPRALPSPAPGATPPVPSTAPAPSGTNEREAGELVVALPPRGTLRGRIQVGDELDLTGSLVFAAPVTDGNELRNRWNALQSMNELPAGFEVASDGAFTLEHLAAGAWQLDLLLPDGKDAGNGIVQPRARVPLGTVEIAANAPTEREFDVRTSGPGGLAFVVTVDGRALEGVELALTARGAPYPTTVLRTSSDGTTSSGPLLPGDFGVTVSVPGKRWTWTAPERPQVRPGKIAEAVLDLRIVEAPLALVDARTQVPIAHRRVTLTQIDATTTSPAARARTDAEGRAAAELVPGRYRLQCEVEPAREGTEPGVRYAPLEFDWTSSGPDPARLELVDAAQPK
ncbi:MAG: carboxypeptidase regulatory-like domain-containing protein [Planctomycetes bacterium]|nr:carboxypeptidase regulatory-like domain-containing protein [Planctomycetota bacterium]